MIFLSPKNTQHGFSSVSRPFGNGNLHTAAAGLNSRRAGLKCRAD